MITRGVLFATQETLERLGEVDVRKFPSSDVAPAVILTDVGTAQILLGLDGQISRLIVAPQQPIIQPPLEVIDPNFELIQPQSGSNVGRLTDSFHLNLTAFGLLSFIVGIFIVHGAIGLALEQRRPAVSYTHLTLPTKA